MFLSRPTKDKNVNIGLCYSILQKCIRRCMISESLYYGNLIYQDGSPNALRKRLIQSCLEDLSRIDLAIELLDVKDIKLFDYIYIIANNKKSRIVDWFSIVCSDYFHYNTNTVNYEELEGIKVFQLDYNKKYKEIRDYLLNDFEDKKINKLYSYMNKDKLVWCAKILWKTRDELKYPLDRTIDKGIKPNKFSSIPEWVMDKHVLNGTPGYQFFFDNGCIIKNRIYEEEPYQVEAINICLSREKNVNDSDSSSELLKNKFRNIEKDGEYTYFATKFSTGKKYFIKNESMVKEFQEAEDLKRILKIATPKVEIINNWLILDCNINSFGVSNYFRYNLSDLFGKKRNFILDIEPKKIVKIILYKILIGSNFINEELIKLDKIYSFNDIFDYKKLDVKIISLEQDFSIKKDWKKYIKLEKIFILELLKKWKKRLKKSNFDWKDNLIRRLKEMINCLNCYN